MFKVQISPGDILTPPLYNSATASSPAVADIARASEIPPALLLGLCRHILGLLYGPRARMAVGGAFL